ncbi:MAG: S53 family peptidase [Streptosporangiaceae bacterium]
MTRLRKARLTAGIVLGVAGLVTPLAALSGSASAAPSDLAGFSALANSVSSATDVITGGYRNPDMKIEVAIAPRDQSGLNSELAALYDKNSAQYHRWLTKGQFDARYAPAGSTRSAVADYLAASGLKVLPSHSPFLVSASGSSTQVSDSFRTTLNTYQDPHGIRYFSNSTPVWLPSDIAGDTLGVIGLTNSAQDIKRSFKPFKGVLRPLDIRGISRGGCQTPYVTTQELFSAVNDSTSFPYGYGAGPDCTGLTPSQTNSIYGAPHVGPPGQGVGVNLAVFEISGYLQSDIDTWAHQFYGFGYRPPLVNINVDGGPLTPACPTAGGDSCIPGSSGYFGDVEVTADIEQQLALSPDMAHLLVYNAPGDDTGQTELDEYTKIANDDSAASISSSWAYCEDDIPSSFAEAENTVFKQMAMQGQSMFSSSGDTGAFECIRSDGTDQVVELDPSSQPWVTSVGGTSLDGFNPGPSRNPRYPGHGAETVWNVDNLCSNAASNPGNDNLGGFFWCGATGAGGGGSSSFWGMPSYQHGPGVINSHTTYGNGTTHCSLAAVGIPCREEPDISADADPYTGYAEYCTSTGPAATGAGECPGSTAAGWFQIGGTSLSSPLWSGIIADRDSFQGRRSGNIGALLYGLYNSDPSLYFHDITGIGQSMNNNGLFPTTPGFDLATGIGTPKMAALITGF